MPRRRYAVRAVLRFIASVLITSGILMLLDAGLTVAWQEPVSAFLGQRQQDQLGDELDREGAALAPERAAAANDKDVARRVRRLAAAWRKTVRRGHPIGRISLPSLH